MLRATVDLFSGRPNPSWIVDDFDESRELLTMVARNPQMATGVDSGYQGLGFRGIRLEVFTDDAVEEFKLPMTFALVNGAGDDPKAGLEVAARLVERMTEFSRLELPEHQYTPINGETQQFVLEQLRLFDSNPPRLYPRPKPPRSTGIRVTVRDEQCEECLIELSKFNPAFWNSDSYVRANNNCYNYARNWRTNTFAQPGRASGCFPYPMACADVEHAAMCDGLHKRCDCLPDSEYPRRFMALVVWPGTPPMADYHWYRKQKGNFWGHKPGNTDARNWDNSNVIITNPETCDRGPYTDFCGYYYAGKSVRII